MSGNIAIDARHVGSAFERACLSELAAIKPGNVGRHGDGHGMNVRDFEKSAVAARPWISRAGATVGERISDATEATWMAVGKNTNLGILLLAAPLCHAAQTPSPERRFRTRLTATLNGLTVADSHLAFAAITRANPAGLGQVSTHDVRQQATVTLREAMCEARDHDRIAFQYAENFADIFSLGLSAYSACVAVRGDDIWATTGVYLAFLQGFPDSHVVRKYGSDAADDVVRRAGQIHATFSAWLRQGTVNDANLVRQLMSLDHYLKARRINPGTSADLTVGTSLTRQLAGTLNNIDPITK